MKPFGPKGWLYLKPNTQVAMQQLIEQINDVMPFGMSEAEICAGKCLGCPKKLVEYISSEIDHHQATLDSGDKPSLADISDLARIATKVRRSLARNGLVSP